MVTAPKCKVCGSAHFGIAHVWSQPAKSAREVVERFMPVGKPAGIVTASGPLKVEAPIVDIDLGPAKHVFVVVADGPKRDRAAYMRAYRAAHPKGAK